MFALALTMMPLSTLADSTQVTAERVRRPPTQWGTVYECTETLKMGCKQDCPSFWEHVGTSDYGCCTSWRSCGGYRKTCQLTYRDFHCYRRRSEAEPIEEADLDEFMSTLEMVDGHWVKLSSSRADYGVADRLHEAGLSEYDGTFEVEQVQPEAEFMSTSDDADSKHFVMEDGEWVELSQEQAKELTTTDSDEGDVDLSEDTEETDTKHFVLENGDWVQLSQEEAKGMTMIADEADEVLPEVSEGARRRWSRFPLFPGWPSGLKQCRDEKTMPCNMPCHGGWSLLVEMENGCCMNGPGGIDYPKPCGFTTKICQKFYLCWD